MKSLLLTLSCVLTLNTLYAQVAPPSVVPGTIGKGAHGLTIFDNKLVFAADDSIHGIELWSYDGVNPATMIADLNPSGNGVSLTSYGIGGRGHNIAVLNSELYFTASNGATGLELYKWDGASTPKIVKDLFAGTSGTASSFPQFFATLNNKLYFCAYTEPSQEQLWVYDPVTDVATKISDVKSVSSYTTVDNIIAYNNKIYFIADSALVPTTLLFQYDVSNGTITKTDAPYIMLPKKMTVVNSKLYFFADTILKLGDYNNLCSIDGNNSRQKLTDFKQNNLLSANDLIIHQNDKIYFWADTTKVGKKFNLMSYDIMSGQLKVLSNPDQNASTSSKGEALVSYHGKVYSSIRTKFSLPPMLLYAYDDVNTPQLIDSTLVDPEEAIVFNDELYFSARPKGASTALRSLYRYNDSATAIQNMSIANDVMLYPNPVNNTSNLSFTLKQEQKLSLTITDALGKIVYRKPVTNYNNSNNKIEFNVHNFSSGIYYCRLATEQNALVWSGKLVKE